MRALRAPSDLRAPLLATVTALAGLAATALLTLLGTPAGAAVSYTCSVPIGGSCGPYSYPAIAMSNGYDTYVANQAINVHGTETVAANGPGDWQVTANLAPCGGCVQTFPDVQQLTNDWCGSVTNWSSCPAPSDLPLSALTKLKIRYSETSPTDAGSSYQFSPDIWDDNYGSDVMFWVDTHGRCNEGAFGSTVLGHARFGKQNWTVHRYGGPGAEIIFVLDGAGGSGTCAQQSAGTVNIKAGFDWLVRKGFVPPVVVFSQLNTGWEITEAHGTSFTVHSYSILVG